MDAALLASFLTASILLALMPGPDNIFVLTESLTKGSRHGIAITIGLCSGVFIHTLAATTGLSIVLKQSALAFTVVKYLGAVYLFYLAWSAIREDRPEFEIGESRIAEFKPFALLRKGFLMNVLNPKVALFFIAFFPQFISPDGWNASLQMVVLGLLFMMSGMLVFGSIALLAGRLSVYLNSDRFWKITKWSKVSVLAALGITLALSER